MHSPNLQIQWRADFQARPEISHVIFDFDGTLSWLRHGWPRMMVEVMHQYFPLKSGESDAAVDSMLMTELLALNGKPTIYQMINFESLVHQRGGTCPSPEALRQEYQDRLDHVIEERSMKIRSGLATQDEFVVFGARALLDELAKRGKRLIILSGTIQYRVQEEADLLGLTPYFGRHIYGGTADTATFSKRQVMDRILVEEGITGGHLLSFGDGPVEIAETKDLGGVSVAVASNEDDNGSGIMDPWKYKQLLEAGADGVIPDFRNPIQLLAKILGS